jgi:hypothetical protein
MILYLFDLFFLCGFGLAASYFDLEYLETVATQLRQQSSLEFI